MKSNMGKIKGTMTIQDIGKNGEVIGEEHYENSFLVNGQNALLEALFTGVSYQYTHIAVGTGDARNDWYTSELEAEGYRKPITRMETDYGEGGHGGIVQPYSLKIYAYFEADEGNFIDINTGKVKPWKEIGLIGGRVQENLEIWNYLLFNRALVNEEKTDSIGKSIVWSIEFA